CLRLLRHCIPRAASRAACTAGKSRPINTPMIAKTTRSSISVKPLRKVPADDLVDIMTDPPNLVDPRLIPDSVASWIDAPIKGRGGGSREIHLGAPPAALGSSS